MRILLRTWPQPAQNPLHNWQQWSELPGETGVLNHQPRHMAIANRSPGVSSRNRNRNALLEPHMRNFTASAPGA